MLFLAILLVDLSLQCILHFLRLGFTLVKDDLFFVATLENAALLLELHVHSVLCDAASCLKIWKIILGLHWRVSSLSHRLRLE